MERPLGKGKPKWRRKLSLGKFTCSRPSHMTWGSTDSDPWPQTCSRWTPPNCGQQQEACLVRVPGLGPIARWGLSLCLQPMISFFPLPTVPHSLPFLWPSWSPLEASCWSHAPFEPMNLCLGAHGICAWSPCTPRAFAHMCLWYMYESSQIYVHVHMLMCTVFRHWAQTCLCACCICPGSSVHICTNLVSSPEGLYMCTCVSLFTVPVSVYMRVHACSWVHLCAYYICTQSFVSRCAYYICPELCVHMCVLHVSWSFIYRCVLYLFIVTCVCYICP